MLDSGSFYNFITEKLVNKFKLNIQKKKKKKKKKKIIVKGISRRTTKLDQFVWLYFQIKFFKIINFIFRKEKFLIFKLYSN